MNHTGQFSKDDFQGYGIRYYTNGDLFYGYQNAQIFISFLFQVIHIKKLNKSYWHGNQRNGNGTLIWKNNNKYLNQTGGFKNNTFKGYGIRYYTNGAKYDGYQNVQMSLLYLLFFRLI